MIYGRMPPLNALRAFEATARHQSVKAAAAELCVTPGAVSQLLKTIEAHLGTQLFRRANRRITLTDAGQDYLPPVRNAFRQIAEASRRVAQAADSGILTVSVTAFFAQAWLVPRLAAFQTCHPDIDLRIVTGIALVDFSRGDVDLAVRHGLGRYPGLGSERVVTAEVQPVASPDLASRLDAADPARWPKVHDADRGGWHRWFQARGIVETGSLRGPSFDDSALLMQAVLGGQGAGLLPARMVAPDIAAGRLTPLGDAVMLDDFAYYLVYPPGALDRPKVAAFRRWLLEA